MKQIILLLILVLTVSISYSQKKSFEETITPYLEKVLDFTEKGAQFVIEETPLVIKQYLYYNAIVYWLACLFGLFIMFPLAKYIQSFTLIDEEERNKAIKYTKENESWKADIISYKRKRKNKYLKTNIASYSEEQMSYSGIDISFKVIGALVIIFTIANAIKVTFFPKLYLVQEFMHFMK